MANRLATTAQYAVKFSEVATIIEDLGAAHNNIQSQLDDLVTFISKNLSPDHWTQDAQTQYQDVQNKWNTDLTDMHNILKNAETTLTQIVQNYDITDKQAAQMWSSVGL